MGKKMLKWLTKYLPVIAMFALVTSYVFSDQIFVQCQWLGFCIPMEGELISRVAPSEEHRKCTSNSWAEADKCLAACNRDLNCANNCRKEQKKAVDACSPVNPDNSLASIPRELAVKEDELARTTVTVNEQKTAVNATQSEIDNLTTDLGKVTLIDKAKPVDAGSQQAANNINSRITALTAIKKNQTDKQTVLETESNTARTQVVKIRSQVSERYSKRMIWILLSSFYLLLSFVAIIASIKVIVDALRTINRASTEGLPRSIRKWLIWTTVLSLLLFAVLFWQMDDFLSFITPILKQSVLANGDIQLNAIHFFNCAGFVAAVWLLSAGNAVYYASMTKAKSQPEIPESLDDIKKTLTKYEKRAALLLYVGAFMLFVGMLRFAVLTDWHLVFVSTTITDEFYKLLESYFKSSIAVQSVFYSLVLLVIYLPGKYAIEYLRESKTTVDTTDAHASTSMLEKIGLPISNDFIAKFAAVLSPVLAGPIIDVLKYLVGSGS